MRSNLRQAVGLSKGFVKGVAGLGKAGINHDFTKRFVHNTLVHGVEPFMPKIVWVPLHDVTATWAYGEWVPPEGQEMSRLLKNFTGQLEKEDVQPGDWVVIKSMFTGDDVLMEVDFVHEGPRVCFYDSHGPMVTSAFEYASIDDMYCDRGIKYRILHTLVTELIEQLGVEDE